ncbi:MAG TPA: DUF3368 domain-containing protein [Caldilineae bacterium]|nr:DUF3368 domain-containing protein [Caldilineae bacterium]
MRVVSNTSPIINLAAIHRLDLLRQLYDRLIIPEAVYMEITASGAGQPGAREVETASWIEYRKVTDRSFVSALRIDLDPGEAEAIALAIEVRADLILLDERRARTVARRLGLKYIGLLGALIEAKHKGYIAEVKPLLDALITRAGFRVSPRLYSHVLSVANEER